MTNEELKQLAEKLIAISEGAEWQYASKGDNTWVKPVMTEIHDCLKHGHQIRLKPRTITVNGIEVPEPLREKPKDGTVCFFPVISVEDFYESYRWTCDAIGGRFLERGLCHATKEAAIAHAKAMLANNSPK